MLESACQVKVGPSRAASVFFTFFVGASILVILSCHISFIHKIIWLCVLLLMSIPLFKQCVIQNPIFFQLVKDKKWIIIDGAETVNEGVLLHDSIATPYFVLLRFQCAHRVRSYPIMWDAIDRNEFKALLLRLKLTHF